MAALLLLLPLAALGQELLVESEPLVDRDAALVLQAQLEDAGAEARLVRRFHQGQGWRFVVVVEHVEDAAQADALAALSESMSVIAVPGAAVEAAPITPAAPPPAAEEEPARLMSADAILRAASRAHGGRESGSAALAGADTVRFAYTRSVPAGEGRLLVDNLYLRSGDALRLEVHIEEGEGTDSCTILTADQQGWISVDGAVTARDGERTLEILQRFSPESILALPLGLPEDVETAAAWRLLQTTARVEEDGQEVWLLEQASDSDLDGLIEATFDVKQHLLRRATWRLESGLLTFLYADYTGQDLVVPLRTSIAAEGGTLEEITITELTLDPELDEALFAAPGAK